MSLRIATSAWHDASVMRGHLLTRLAAITAASIAIGGLVVDTARPSAAAAPGPARSSAPSISRLTISKHRLPSTGGHVRVGFDVHNAVRCELRARPALPHGRYVKSCRNGAVHWRLRVPRAAVARPVTYHLTIRARAPHHVAATRTRRIVLRRPPAPHMRDVTVSSSQLPSIGGAVRFIGIPTAGRKCTLRADPPILGLPATHRCSNTRTAWKLRVPPNPLATARRYRFTLTARGEAHQAASHMRTVTVAAQTPTCPGQTSIRPPRTGAFFNDPTSARTADHQAVVDAMINLICSTSPPTDGVPTSIDLAMYIDESEAVTNALLWAQQYRSAVVHVALDGSNSEILTSTGDTEPNPAYDDLVAGLPPGSVVLCGPNAGTVPAPPDGDSRQPVRSSRGLDPSGPTTYVGTGCAGDNILHDKLLLVSSVDNLGDSAVLTTSQNLSTHAVASAFNNGLQLVGNSAVYDATRSYFAQLMTNTRDPQLGEDFDAGPFKTSAGRATFTAYPRNASDVFPVDNTYNADNDRTSDAIADLLSHVSCAAPGRHAGNHSGGTPRTTVRIAVYSYGLRDLVTSRLARLARAGCDVQVIYTSMAGATRTALINNGISPMKLSDSTYPLPGGRTGRIFVHDKYLLISGAMTEAGHVIRNQDIVQTGSENLTELGLHHNDDQTIRIQRTATGDPSDVALYTAYRANWSRLRAAVKTARNS
jgi:hypothetical protein